MKPGASPQRRRVPQGIQVRASRGEVVIRRDHLLQRERDVQERAVPVPAPDELEAEGQPVRVAPARDGDGGVARIRHRIGEAEPLVVAGRRDAVDLGRRGLRPGSGAQRGGGGDDDVVAVEEGLPAAVVVALHRQGLRRVGGGVSPSLLDVRRHEGADPVGRPVDRLGEGGQERERAQHGEDAVGPRAVGMHGLGPREGLRQTSHHRVEGRAHGPFGRREAEIGRHAHAQRREVGRTRGREAGRVPGRPTLQDGRVGIGAVGPGHRGQKERRILDGPGHRSVGREGDGREDPVGAGHDSGAGAEPHDAAIGRRRAERSAHVGPRGERGVSQGQRHGRPARRAGAGPVERVGVRGRPVDAVAGVGAGAPFRHVGLAEGQRARRADGRDGRVVARGQRVDMELRSVGRGQAAHVLHVLHRDGQAVEKGQRLAGPHRGLRGAGRGPHPLEIRRDDGVDRMVERLDARDAGIGQLEGRQGAAADELAGPGGREVCGVHAPTGAGSPGGVKGPVAPSSLPRTTRRRGRGRRRDPGPKARSRRSRTRPGRRTPWPRPAGAWPSGR